MIQNKIGKHLSFLIIMIVMCLPQNSEAVSKYRLEKIVTDLDQSPETYKKAQEEFVSIGREAIPRLLQEVQKYIDPSDDNLQRSARALATINKMQSTEAISTAIAILLRFDIGKHLYRWKFLLANEAFRYILNEPMFADKRCRDAYYELCTRYRTATNVRRDSL